MLRSQSKRKLYHMLYHQLLRRNIHSRNAHAKLPADDNSILHSPQHKYIIIANGINEHIYQASVQKPQYVKESKKESKHTPRHVGRLGRDGEELVVGQYLADFGGPQPPLLSLLQYLRDVCRFTTMFQLVTGQSTPTPAPTTTRIRSSRSRCLVLKTLFVRSELLGGKVSKTPETSQSLSFFEKK